MHWNMKTAATFQKLSTPKRMMGRNTRWWKELGGHRARQTSSGRCNFQPSSSLMKNEGIKNGERIRELHPAPGSLRSYPLSPSLKLGARIKSATKERKSKIRVKMALRGFSSLRWEKTCAKCPRKTRKEERDFRK